MLTLFKRNKKLIIYGAIVVMLIGLFLKVLVDLNYVSMTMSLNYTGVEKGLNPDNTRFNIFEMTSNKVLDDTLKKVNIPNMTVDELRGRINIYPIINKGVNERIKDANASGKDFAYFPNVYTIIYSQKNKFEKNHTRQLLLALAESYKEYFKKQYTDKSGVLNDINFDVKDDEYIDVAEIFNSRITGITDYLSSKQQENASFRSVNTNQTFNNLISGFQTIKNVDVANMNAYVNMNKAYKDKNALLEKLTYNLSELKFKYDSYAKETAIVKDAMQKYELSITESMYVSSVDQNNNLYMNKTKTGFDYLTEKAVKKGVEMESVQKDIQSGQQKIDTYINAQQTPEQLKAYADTIEAMMNDIQKKISELSKIAITTVEEYSTQKTKDYLTYKVPPFSLRDFLSFGYVKAAGMYALLGFILAFLLALIIDLNYILENVKLGKSKVVL